MSATRISSGCECVLQHVGLDAATADLTSWYFSGGGLTASRTFLEMGGRSSGTSWLCPPQGWVLGWLGKGGGVVGLNFLFWLRVGGVGTLVGGALSDCVCRKGSGGSNASRDACVLGGEGGLFLWKVAFDFGVGHREGGGAGFFWGGGVGCLGREWDPFGGARWPAGPPPPACWARRAGGGDATFCRFCNGKRRRKELPRSLKVSSTLYVN